MHISRPTQIRIDADIADLRIFTSSPITATTNPKITKQNPTNCMLMPCLLRHQSFVAPGPRGLSCSIGRISSSALRADTRGHSADTRRTINGHKTDAHRATVLPVNSHPSSFAQMLPNRAMRNSAKCVQRVYRCRIIVWRSGLAIIASDDVISLDHISPPILRMGPDRCRGGRRNPQTKINQASKTGRTCFHLRRSLDRIRRIRSSPALLRLRLRGDFSFAEQSKNVLMSAKNFDKCGRIRHVKPKIYCAYCVASEVINFRLLHSLKKYGLFDGVSRPMNLRMGV